MGRRQASVSHPPPRSHALFALGCRPSVIGSRREPSNHSFAAALGARLWFAGPKAPLCRDQAGVSVATNHAAPEVLERGRDRAQVLDRLKDGIQELTSGQRWADWLAFCGRFHRYSFHNQVLILAQRPDASWVAGYRAWQLLGRQVRRGERGIAIFAPRSLDSSKHDPTDEDECRVVRFRVVRVFDVAQTDGQELPRPLRELAGHRPRLELDRLLGLAGRLGFTVEFLELRRDRHGDCSHVLRRIRIDRRLAPAQLTKTLCHELAHAILHGEDFAGSRPLAELEAESVAYGVCDELGIDSSEYSLGYVASWAGGGEQAVAQIAAAGTRITAAAGRILEQVGDSAEA